MSQSGKSRKEKRKARQRADEPTAMSHTNGDGNGGQGATAYLTPGHENRIIGRMLRTVEWPVTEDAANKAVEITIRNMGHEDGRVSNGAIRNLLSMNKQNQDQNNVESGKTGNTDVNVNVGILLNQPADQRRSGLAAIARNVGSRTVATQGDSGSPGSNGHPKPASDASDAEGAV